jgi:hypothetical protein
MAVKLKVIYADGREVVAVATPRAQVMTEQFIGFADEHKVQAGYYLAWASLNRAGKEAADYETWLDTIAEVEEVSSEEPSPTPPAQSTDSSSD